MNENSKRGTVIMRRIVIMLAVAVASLASTWPATAGDLMYGCRSRPACGKACRLVCDTTTLTAIGYGCECKAICIPGPSQSGCKHCETRCCCDDDVKGCRPKMEFCWYDWFACGCARPRTVKVLTKYQAEKTIPSYHWEVVDCCSCGCCPRGCHCVYKSAPPEAAVGEVLALSVDEQVEVTNYLSESDSAAVEPAAATAEVSVAEATEKATAWQRLTRAIRLSNDTE
jgi:hypothetical protein